MRTLQKKRAYGLYWLLAGAAAVFVLRGPWKGINICFPLGSRVSTSTDAIYTAGDLEEALEKDYPELYAALAGSECVYIIPGLVQAATVDLEGNPAVSTQMDPQGMALTDDYVVISAYSRDKKYNSVLYILDRRSGRYLRTLILPGRPHAGGLAWDSEGKNLWIADGEEAGAAKVSCIGEETLRGRFLQDPVRIEYDYTALVPQMERVSFLSVEGRYLYAGMFSETGQGAVVSFPLKEDGMPDTERERTVSCREKIQGVAGCSQGLLFSRSFGPANSKLSRYAQADPDNWEDFLEESMLDEIDFPPYMEQIAIDGDCLYVLFESSSSPYRDNPEIFHSDRIMQFSLAALYEEK